MSSISSVDRNAIPSSGDFFDSLSFSERYKISKDSGAYNFIEAFFRAMGKFSPEEQREILTAFNGKGSDAFRSDFVSLFKRFQVALEQCNEAEDATAQVALLQKSLSDLFRKSKIELSQKSNSFFLAMLSESISSDVKKARSEIRKRNEEELLQKYGQLKPNGNIGECVALYRELMEKFFRGEPPSSSSAPTDVKEPSLETPSDRDFIVFDGATNDFTYGKFEHLELSKMASDLRKRIGTAWNENPSVMALQKLIKTATDAANEKDFGKFEAAREAVSPFYHEQSSKISDLDKRFRGTGHCFAIIHATNRLMDQLSREMNQA